ncbi:hypothetical protein R3P38DRAFT_3253123 [Favolaschia claudopus]|uniref:Uncharacterized protein n=1 Tax=Favolaschia claudopus TaxID=2862362 RepID=A0AAW0E037_9AGAR
MPPCSSSSSLVVKAKYDPICPCLLPSFPRHTRSRRSRSFLLRFAAKCSSHRRCSSPCPAAHLCPIILPQCRRKSIPHSQSSPSPIPSSSSGLGTPSATLSASLLSLSGVPICATDCIRRRRQLRQFRCGGLSLFKVRFLPPLILPSIPMLKSPRSPEPYMAACLANVTSSASASLSSLLTASFSGSLNRSFSASATAPPSGQSASQTPNAAAASGRGVSWEEDGLGLKE